MRTADWAFLVLLVISVISFILSTNNRFRLWVLSRRVRGKGIRVTISLNSRSLGGLVVFATEEALCSILGRAGLLAAPPTNPIATTVLEKGFWPVDSSPSEEEVARQCHLLVGGSFNFGRSSLILGRPPSVSLSFELFRSDGKRLKLVGSGALRRAFTDKIAGKKLAQELAVRILKEAAKVAKELSRSSQTSHANATR